MIYQLQQRRWVGVSIGYFTWDTIETFEDLQLALKEEANLTRRWSQTYRVLEVHQ